jgi:CBS domain-containing protein
MVKRKINLIMTKEVITTKPNESIKEVIKKLTDNSISGLPVVDDENRIVGIVSEKDILTALKTEFRTVSLVFPSSHALGMTFEETTVNREINEALKELKNLKIEKIMNEEVIVINPENTISEVLTLMVKNNINRIPVVKNEKLVGIVTRGDVLKGLANIR